MRHRFTGFLFILALLLFTERTLASAEHWAFHPLNAPQSSNDVDDYIDEGLKRAKLSPAPQASKRSLVRRLYLDLIGLPPSKAELDQALVRNDPGGQKRIVDQLLNSAHFGEKWARQWLDVARYSETKGHVTDIERAHTWKYRDYVIDAFNDDLLYDQFISEHIAGDLLPQQERTIDGKQVDGFPV